MADMVIDVLDLKANVEANKFSEREATAALNKLNAELNTLHAEGEKAAFSADQSARWDGLVERAMQFKDRIQHSQESAARRSALLELEEKNKVDSQFSQKRENYEGYSLMNVIAGKAGKYEREISDKFAEIHGDPKGIYIPLGLPVVSNKFALNLSNGAGLIDTTRRGDLMIDVLRKRKVSARWGVRMLEGLQGNIKIPKKTTATAGSWVTEGGAPTATQPATGSVTLDPHTIAVVVEVTRSMMKQSMDSMEDFVREDIFAGVLDTLEAAIFNGTGADGQPTGLLQGSTIPTVAIGTNGGAITWAKTVELETTVGTANGDEGVLAYITNSKVRGALKTIERAANTAQFLWDSNNMVNSYMAMITEHMPSNLTKGTANAVCSAMIFGNGNDVLVGNFGAIDLVIDSVSSNANSTFVKAYLDCDVELRRAGSFAKIVDITTA